MKYKIEDLKENGKFIIYIGTKEEHSQILKLVGKYNLSGWYGPCCYSLRKGTYCPSSNENYKGSYPSDSIIVTMKDILYTIEEIKAGKFAIKCSNSEEGNNLIRAFNPKMFTRHSFSNSEEKFVVYYYPDNPTYGIEWDYLRDFKDNNQLVGYNQVIVPNVIEERKIIGYKTPYDLFRGDIPKGTIYYETGGTCFSRHTDNQKHNDTYLIPKEIVITWEPVYGDKEKIITLSNGELVTVKEKFILAEGKEISLKSLEDILTITKFPESNWDFVIDTFHVGCWKNLKRKDIELILETSEELK